MGEICRCLKQIYEHMRYFKIADINNVLVKHNLETNHNFNFNDSKMLVNIQNKNTEKLLNLVGWLFGFYGRSTFVGYLMPNPFLYK